MLGYLLATLIFACKLARKAKDLSLIPSIVASFLVIHASWGLSFMLGLVSTRPEPRDTNLNPVICE